MSGDYEKQGFKSLPYLLVDDNLVIEAGDQFLELTGHEKADIINKDIDYLCHNVLRLNANGSELEKGQKSFFMFTKNLDPREIKVQVSLSGKPGVKAYIFEEKPNSRIADKFKNIEQLCLDNLLGVSIYSIPDLILLKASQKYLDFFAPPYNTMESCIGKCIYDFARGWKNSPSELIWRNAISTGKSAIAKEQEHTGFERGVTYWDAVITPVSEDGVVKFITSQTTDATERVVNRELAEEQAKALREKNDELQAIIDTMSDDLYIIEKDGTIRTINSNAVKSFKNRARNIFENYTVSKYYDLSGNEISFENMPSSCLLRGEKITGKILHTKSNSLERYVVVNGSPIFDQDENVLRAVYCHHDITEFMLQSRIMSRQKEQLEAVIKNMTYGILAFDADLKPIIYNTAMIDVLSNLGVDINTWTDSARLVDYYDEKGQPIPLENLPSRSMLSGKTIVPQVISIKSKQGGSTVYLNVSGTPIMDNKGNFFYGVLCMQDITELINNKKQIADQNKQLQAIFENMSDTLFIFDKWGKYILINKELTKDFTNNGPAKIGLGLKQFTCYDWSGKEIAFEDLPANRIIRGESISEYRILLKNVSEESYVCINGKPVYDDNGEFIFGIMCMRHITEQVRSEQMLKQQKDFLQNILDNAYENLLVFDSNDKYLVMKNNIVKEASSEFNNIHEIFRAATYYYMDGTRIPLENMATCRVMRGEVIEDDIMHLKVNDHEYYIIVNGMPVTDENGNFLYGIVSGRNITEFMKSQQELKQAQELLLKAKREKIEVLENAMQMKDEFLATITHEFKTPLTVINAALQTIEGIYGNQLSDKVKKHLKRISMNSFRQLRLVNNLLDITRFKAGHLKISKRNLDIVFLTSAITKSVDLYAKQKGIEIRFASDIRSKEMAIDEEKYERILLNLLSNAIKFTPKDKCIYIHISCRNRKAVIMIKDEGIGIPQDKQKLIFERFGQVDSSLSRQAEGTGIGLSLVKTLIDGLNGAIKVESKVGKGSTFTVELPITKLRRKEPELTMSGSQDSRIMQAVAIEFSDIYLQ